MKGLVYGGLGLWLMSLSVWAYGEIFDTVELTKAQKDVVEAEETLNGPDRLDDRVASDVRVLRLEGFAKVGQTARTLSPLGSRMPSGDASRVEEPL